MYIGKAEDKNYWFIQKNFLKYVNPKTRKAKIFEKIEKLTLEKYLKLPPKVKKTLQKLHHPTIEKIIEKTNNIKENLYTLKQHFEKYNQRKQLDLLNTLLLINREILEKTFQHLVNLYYTIVHTINTLKYKKITKKRIEEITNKLINTVKKTRKEIKEMYIELVKTIEDKELKQELTNLLKTYNPKLGKYVPLKSPLYKTWRSIKYLMTKIVENHVQNYDIAKTITPTLNQVIKLL